MLTRDSLLDSPARAMHLHLCLLLIVGALLNPTRAACFKKQAARTQAVNDANDANLAEDDSRLLVPTSPPEEGTTPAILPPDPEPPFVKVDEEVRSEGAPEPINIEKDEVNDLPGAPQQTKLFNTSAVYADDDGSRILGGTDVTSIAAYPYVVYVKVTNADTTTTDCGGAVLSATYVLTAAQCVYQAATIDVYAGFTDTTGTLPTAVKGTATIYPNFRRYNNIHDIALVRTSSLTLGTGTVDQAKVPWGQKANAINALDNYTVRILGFGGVTASDAVTKLKYVDVVQMSRSSCNTKMLEAWLEYPSTISCLDSSAGTKGACSGDPGSPVLYKFPGTSFYTLAGVISDKSYCTTAYPGAYTRIQPYLSWIKSTVKDLVLIQGR